MNDAFFKPSLNVESFIGENSSVDTERFLLFMKAYYEWMQSTTLSLTNKTGTFVVGETIVGAISGATASIKEVKTNSIVIAPTSRTVFAYTESVTGQTSGATATINIIKDNVGRASGNILNYKNLETSVDKYVEYLREELYPSIPATYYGNKQLVAQYFKDFYESKSNEQSYRFLFKLLYDENIDFYYPGEDVLRISDGNFEKTQIIRTEAVAIGIDSTGTPFSRDIFLYLNKTIRGKTSGVLANVVDIKKFFIGSLEVAEMTLKLVSGTFAAGEDIVDIDDDDLVTTIYGIVSSVTIVDGGSGYEDGDIVTITGDGSEAQARVSSIKESPISALRVNTVGHGYQLNTNATIDNSGTGGSGFLVQVTALANTYSVTSGANTFTVGEISEVSVLNRGEGYFKKPSITLQDTTIASLGLLSDKLITINNAGSNYGVGNTLVFTGGSGANAAGQIASVIESTTFDLLFEDGFQMKADGSYYDIIKNEDWSVIGAIKRVELTNFGTGYSSASLPVITVNTTTGSSANLVATNIQGKSANVTVDTSNNITGIGSIRAVEITNFGIDYSAANASAATVGDGNAILSPVISGLGIREGVFLDDDGKIDYKIIQDSYYYQDYSYVIKSGLTFETYSNTLKSIIHPAGLIYFGEIQILNDLDVHAELINNPDIQRMLVQIFTHLTVGAEYQYSSITWSIKVEAPVIRLDTGLDVQEYIIHLVPEGDDETGITDVGITINQNDVRHSFVIQTPFDLDVTATSATLPTTKFVVSKLDILPGYGENTYGNLTFVPYGVYNDDLGSSPISALQDVRFSDLYSENPAYVSIMNLFIDNEISATISTESNLKYTIQKFSGNIPVVDSIITTESLTPIPEIFINLTADISTTQLTEMKRVLPVINTSLSNLDVVQEYVLSGHGVRYKKYADDLILYYETIAIDPLANTALDDFIISPSSLVDMNVEMIVSASSVLPQKFASAENLAYLYRIDLSDVSISEVADETFIDLLPQSLYEGTSTAYETSTFGTIYTVQPKQYQEYIKVLPVTTTEMNNLSVNREIIVHSEGSGFKYTIYDDVLFSDYETLPISALADFTFDTNLGTTTYDVTIKATTSPYTTGQSARRNSTDIFRDEIVVKTQSETSAYDTLYEDVRISALQTLTFNDVVPGTTDVIGQQTFGSVYPQAPQTSATYVKYEKIVGTVSSANAGFETLPISAYSAIAIDGVDDSLLSDLVPIVIGSGTDFSNESLPLGFAVGGVFVANNEYFTVESIANSTYMTTDRLPASPFSGVVAYRIPA
jgi:hypothetical protein